MGAGGDADATLAALTGAKDSSRLPGRDGLMGGETPSGAGLSGKVGRAPCSGGCCSALLALGRPLLFLGFSPFILPAGGRLQ